MIYKIFQIFDVDDSGFVTFEEFKLGLEGLALKQRIHVSIDDWHQFISHISHTGAKKDMINEQDFDVCMRMELRNYAHRGLCDNSYMSWSDDSNSPRML